MKINLFIDCLGAGGAQRQLVGLAIMLKEKDYDVKVSTYYDIDFYKKQLDDACVPNELIPGASNIKKRILAVRSYFKKEKPDWVVAYQETPSLVACAAKVLGCKFRLIVSERNTTQVVGMNERVRFFLYHWADNIVPNSYSQEKYLTEHHPWMKKKLKTITNFVDLNRFAPNYHHRECTPHIIVVASLWQSKNARGLINACKLLKDEGIKIKIYWYGLNDKITQYQKDTLQMVINNGLGDYIYFLPKLKQIEYKYREADFFCLPSFYEGTPNVICEALASGLPVICSDVCDNGIYVKEGTNGFLFNPYDSQSIAKRIKDSISLSNIQYENYCKNSRLIAEKSLSREFFLLKYEQILLYN